MPDIKTSSADPRSLLIELLGKAFVNWLLPTYGNAEVQLEIANALLAHAAKATELNQAAGGRYLIVGLLGYVPDWGDTGINALRLQAGGEPVPAPTSTGDATVDALGELAAERIGEMLLPVGRFGPDLVTSYRTPALDRAIAAIR
ncbi:MAG: hypothetical protein LH624_02255, partial [Cryobacterium sp.]|nr:hypothetical protein [Cryobacterium sp.]